MTKFLLIILILVSQLALANNKTICGVDERSFSATKEIGRVMKYEAKSGCTLTLIGKSCAVSAGHCVRVFEQAQFNTPVSRNGEVVYPNYSDIYLVDSSSIVYEEGAIGNDYAVLRLRRNQVSGLYPGELQGHLNIAPRTIREAKSMIHITGYGRDLRGPNRNFSQQFHYGEIISVDRSKSIIKHQVDTMGGNSGSAIIDAKSGKIIGIHTHGGCYEEGGANHGTLIATHKAFKQAIKNCLDWEKKNIN